VSVYLQQSRQDFVLKDDMVPFALFNRLNAPAVGWILLPLLQFLQ